MARRGELNVPRFRGRYALYCASGLAQWHQVLGINPEKIGMLALARLVLMNPPVKKAHRSAGERSAHTCPWRGTRAMLLGRDWLGVALRALR